jgi:hypothetical protein
MLTVIEETAVQHSLDKAAQKYLRIHDIFGGLTWRMAREPQAGHQIPRYNPPVYLIKIDPDIAFQHPGITALYRYNDNEVNVIAIKILPPPSPPKRRRP